MTSPEVVKKSASVQRHDGEERLRELRRDLEYERLLGDDEMAGALMYGANSREDRIMQMDALVEMQRKILRRGSTAHVIVLSANVLTMAVMASQFAMFRWKVTEAQTLTEATACIQHQVLRAQKGGFTVQRVSVAKSTRDLEKEKFRRKVSSDLAHAAEERMGLIPADEKRKAAPATDAASIASAVGTERMQSVRESEDNDHPVSPSSSVCSAENEAEVQKLPPDDMVAQLIVVDTFTHEPFSDIVDHLRFFDRENSLGLVIVLMLYDNYDKHSPGMVILPKHTITVSEAYNLGYDLVLRRCFDHTVVKFFTEMFMSAKGRWCKEMHSKGVVGNYRGMRQILLEQDDLSNRNGLLSVPDVDECSNNGSDEISSVKNLQSSYMSSTPLSSTLATLSPQLLMTSVRGAVASAPQQRMQKLQSLFNVKDILTNVMTPSKSVKHAKKRLFRRSNSVRDFPAGSHGGEIESGDKNDESVEKIYEDALVDEKEEIESAVVAAYKEEVLRLMTGLECSERTVALLREEVAQLRERASSDNNFGTNSPFTSNSCNESGPENFISVSKEQQVITLRQRLMSVTDKLMAYEMQNNNQGRKRKHWLQDNRIGTSPLTMLRPGTTSPEGDAQDVFSNTATTMHGMGTVESSLLEQTGHHGRKDSEPHSFAGVFHRHGRWWHLQSLQ
ncbi:dispersed gene family protein 1 (DGF-1), putative [Trypanosoma cruzi marinkellei]|uniref:Dispersed gene family protein 1 (DGF-1), putative n=1 Tax=Trypanosoma cruzi marinkellei TaxID=85056 RepID=K2MXJ6_TRYCR|nr:dispersed gene family protein 1 (DGF-1), putative [Trypanosoma cruzi marinkellei]